jgi:membrane-associated phospholipid phosphatase
MSEPPVPSGRAHLARRVALVAYVVLLAGFVVVEGMPLDRVGQALWVLGGITAAMVGRPVQDYMRVLRDWSLFFAALLLYDHSRGIADTLGMPVQVESIARAEEILFGGTIPTVWLQDRLYDPLAVHWYDVIVSLVYVSHFFLVWAIGAVLYVRARDQWGWYARRALLLTFAGLATYMLVPAGPPWYAGQAGVIDEVERISTRGWAVLGLHRAGNALESAQAGSNHVAAMPSLHAAFSLLVVLLLWPYVRRPALRALLLAYPVAMAFTLVYGGEHYVVDVLVGFGYALAVVAAATAWEDWRERRAALPSAAAVDAGGPERERIEARKEPA